MKNNNNTETMIREETGLNIANFHGKKKEKKI
jgi:hypothetical protein